MKKTRCLKPNIFVRGKNRVVKQAREGLLFNIGALIAFAWALSFLVVIIWGINISLMSPQELETENAHYFTHTFSFINYINAFDALKTEVSKDWYWLFPSGKGNYWFMLFNSLWFSLGSTIMKLISTICFAYVIARYRFPGRKFLYFFVIIQMMLPTYGHVAANYKLLSGLGLVDSPLFLLAMGAGHGMFFLICHSYFESLPSAYEESARIDGSGYFRSFIQIMLPLAKPIIVCIGLLTFISCWNDYTTTLLYLPHWRTLTSALFSYSEITMHSSKGSIPVYFAGIIVSAIPILVLYIVFNKALMSNMTIGGIKG